MGDRSSAQRSPPPRWSRDPHSPRRRMKRGPLLIVTDYPTEYRSSCGLDIVVRLSNTYPRCHPILVTPRATVMAPYNVEVLVCDFCDLQSVCRLVDELRQRASSMNKGVELIVNAAIYGSDHGCMVTETIEEQFMVNVVLPFVLVRSLQTELGLCGGRVINLVSSIQDKYREGRFRDSERTRSIFNSGLLVDDSGSDHQFARTQLGAVRDTVYLSRILRQSNVCVLALNVGRTEFEHVGACASCWCSAPTTLSATALGELVHNAVRKFRGMQWTAHIILANGTNARALDPLLEDAALTNVLEWVWKEHIEVA